MVISISKKIPKSSSFYPDIDGGGTGLTANPVTITLNGVSKVIVHSKKVLIKIVRRQNKNKQAGTTASDQNDTKVIDLKNGTDDIKINGWIEDATDTAWETFWKLRAMCTSGGSLYNLTIENIEFKNETQEAFLEDIVQTFISDDTGVINVNKGSQIARIEVVLTFFIGDER